MNENTEKIKEEIENKDEEVSNKIIKEEVEEVINSLPKKKIVKKHIQAMELVEKAKIIVKEAEDQNAECKLLLVEDLKEYEEVKVSLRDGGLDTCSYLLEKLGYQHKLKENDDSPKVVFEPKDDAEPIILKDVSSGRFTGFICSLIGGTLTVGGLVYLAAEKLGTTLYLDKIPSKEDSTSILSWFSTVVGFESNIYIGAGTLGILALAVMTLIYAIRVGLKGNSNLDFAIKQLEEAEVYMEHKGDCKKEMDNVDAHMKDAIETLKTYEVLFNEQKGKLERILHIEGEKLKSTDYHEKSFIEIRETKELMHTIREFMATPMSEEGKLSEQNEKSLKSIKKQMDKMLKRLY